MVLSLLNELDHFLSASSNTLTLTLYDKVFYFKYFVFIGRGNFFDKLCGFREPLPSLLETSPLYLKDVGTERLCFP